MWVSVGLVPDQQAVGGTTATHVEAESTDVGPQWEGGGVDVLVQVKLRENQTLPASLLYQRAVSGCDGEVVA